MIVFEKIFRGRDYLQVPRNVQAADIFASERNDMVDMVLNPSGARCLAGKSINSAHLGALRRGEPRRCSSILSCTAPCSAGVDSLGIAISPSLADLGMASPPRNFGIRVAGLVRWGFEPFGKTGKFLGSILGGRPTLPRPSLVGVAGINALSLLPPFLWVRFAPLSQFGVLTHNALTRIHPTLGKMPIGAWTASKEALESFRSRCLTRNCRDVHALDYSTAAGMALA